MSLTLAPLLEPFGRGPSAGAFAYERLRVSILSLDLAPGAALPRAVLAERLGLSQTPVREALIRLAAEGLIEVVPSASTRVARIDLASAREAHFLRRAVEVELVRALSAMPPASFQARLQTILQQQQSLLDGDDHAGFTAADENFHRTLYQAGGIGGLWDLVHSRSGHLDRLRRLHLPTPGKADAILREHRTLTEAILAGDAAAAEMVLRMHVADTFARIPEIRATHPDYFQAD